MEVENFENPNQSHDAFLQTRRDLVNDQDREFAKSLEQDQQKEAEKQQDEAELQRLEKLRVDRLSRL